jgi:hypothetical protein
MGFEFAGGISVFFPAFNDAPSLPSLINRTFEVLRRVAGDFEVIVVNDGSSDATQSVLEDLQQQYGAALRVIRHEKNLGYGAALRTGFSASTKEFVFYTDGDGQYDPAEIEDLLRAVTPATGLVNGYKAKRNDPWHRIAIGCLYNQFARRLFGIHLRDIDCDFRLIRRSALDLAGLQSTGGTICVELVRSLELSGSEVVELPVKHYPRLHGRSQFFRVRSLLQTLFQLGEIYWRLVAQPNLLRYAALWVLLCVTALSVVAYWPSLHMPFIADDYVQIQLGRDYGAFSGWAALAQDALYRCRATSLVLTHWTETLFGLNPLAYNGSSLLIHIANCFLVFLLGSWRAVGWRVSTVAACFFAVCQRHSEAVIWYAALPELLVFFFSMATFLLWVKWLQMEKRSPFLYGATLACYVLALLSKESAVAVVPLCVVAALHHSRLALRPLLAAAPMVALAGIYFAMAHSARATHLHFNDGTFSLGAPFLLTMLRSGLTISKAWGIPALVLLFAWKAREWRSLVLLAGAWISITLLPYSFLTYNPVVPSRHTYWASVGTSLIVAAALIVLRNKAASLHRDWLVMPVITAILVHQTWYLWAVKDHQYRERAYPTEELVRIGAISDGPIYSKCFPYTPIVGELALQYRLTKSPTPVFITGPEAARNPNAIDFCTAAARQ